MDSCSLGRSDMQDLVHLRFAVKGDDFPREIIDLDNDLSVSVRLIRPKKFGAHPRKSPSGTAEPVKVPKEP